MRIASRVTTNPPVSMLPRVVAILGFDGVSALDVTGPLEALARANLVENNRTTLPCYRPVIVGLKSKEFLAESGLTLKATVTIKRTAWFDTIIIPGGKGLAKPEVSLRASSWITSQAAKTRRIASISTGIYALARTGLLDGRQVTTHWRVSQDVARRFPRLRVNHTASFLKDGRFYTSAGGPSGVEMTLALIAEDYGYQVAKAVARELLMRSRQTGLIHDYLEATDYEADPSERVADLPAWILGHLNERLTVETLAERACLCPRHFTRVFRKVFEYTPADFVEELRLSEARRRLLSLRSTVESVASSVGFKSSDAFRRAFERRVGVTPTAFRRNARSEHESRTNDAGADERRALESHYTYSQGVSV